ncbi:MAG: exo-alpha-sialidase [Gemmatimonadales bacterium]|nr:exo-alpha-sialidase [Gemmatimonadales bacterium]
MLLMARRTYTAALLCLVGTNAAPRTARAPDLLIRVGPNVLLTRNESAPRAETTIAASATDAGRLVAAAVTNDVAETGSEIYTSSDGGHLWQRLLLPSGGWTAGADPQVAFDLDGRAYFARLARKTDPNAGRGPAATHVYRSIDGGGSWSDPVALAPPAGSASFDRPVLVVDQSSSRFRGRVYVVVRAGDALALTAYRSTDGAVSFSAPVPAVPNEPAMVFGAVVLGDGTLLVPYLVVAADPALRAVRSSDGGESFSAPMTIAGGEARHDSAVARRTAAGVLSVAGMPSVAAGREPGTGRDVVYVLRMTERSGRARIVMYRSTDRGATWSEPREIAPHERGFQYQPSVAVNAAGVVAITWLDTRDATTEWTQRLYVTASTDGGRTFLPAKAVSSVASSPLASGNLAPIPAFVTTVPGRGRLAGTGTLGRFMTGGDYFGLTAGLDGAFHPIWADSRTGSYLPWTARIEVATVGAPSRLAGGGVPSAVKGVGMVVDRSVWDPERAVTTVWVRLHNLSRDTIHGPITVVLLAPDPRLSAAEVLNSANRISGADAVFDYSGALGDFGMLIPGGVTEAIPWEVRSPGPRPRFFLEAEVRGVVRR